MQVLQWQALDTVARSAALARPPVSTGEELRLGVAQIIDQVRQQGDQALRTLTASLDGADLQSLRVGEAEKSQALGAMSTGTLEAMQSAIANIMRFHEAQRPSPLDLETAPGVRCERVIRPLGSVGLYVPAGSAALPSTVLMLALPALVAGCPRRVICTPPGKDGKANAAVLAAARLCGVDEIYKVGGAQAIAAMAYGTQSIARVDKIFGPGNAWVTAAKMAVAMDPAGCVCDMPAGPSEVLVIADGAADAALVASDLLSQAEHGVDSQVMLVTTDPALAQAVNRELLEQLLELPRADIARGALASSRTVLVPDVETAIVVSNAYAPEHLIMQVENARDYLPGIQNAGSVFLGPWTPESVGDYCSGTNHVLPTYGYARSVSGLSVDDFLRKMTVQELTAGGLQAIGPVARTLAELEGLQAHANAVSLRLNRLGQGD
jgi:histidinol dehydrogenase